MKSSASLCVIFHFPPCFVSFRVFSLFRENFPKVFFSAKCESHTVSCYISEKGKVYQTAEEESHLIELFLGTSKFPAKMFREFISFCVYSFEEEEAIIYNREKSQFRRKLLTVSRYRFVYRNDV